MSPKKKKKLDDEFFLKERAYDLIKEKFEDVRIIEDGKGYYLIAYKKNLWVHTQNNNNAMMPYERKDEKTFCILRVVAYEDIPIKKDLKEWLDLGCEHSYITETGFFVEDVRN